MNDWRNVWNNKATAGFILEDENPEIVFMELKRAMGVSKIGDKETISYKDFYNQFMDLYKELTIFNDTTFKPKSFFDVGCGTGGYLYLLSKLNSDFVLGGIDYSLPFIKIASQILPKAKELFCGDATQINLDTQYDCVYSRSIFQYFPDKMYAKSVLDKMLSKARYSVGVFDIHDLSKKDDFLSYRKSIITDYDTKYDDNSHLFFDRDFFSMIAEEKKCKIKFSRISLPNYWNSAFTYDVFFYKK